MVFIEPVTAIVSAKDGKRCPSTSGVELRGTTGLVVSDLRITAGLQKRASEQIGLRMVFLSSGSALRGPVMLRVRSVEVGTTITTMARGVPRW